MQPKETRSPGVLYCLHYYSSTALLIIDAYAEMVAIDRYYQRGKNVVHALQALLIFLGALVTIAIYTKGGNGDGRVNYYFVLVSTHFIFNKICFMLIGNSASFPYQS